VTAAEAPAFEALPASDVAAVAGGGAEAAPFAAPIACEPSLLGAAADAAVVDAAPGGGAEAGTAVGVSVVADALLAAPWLVLAEEPDVPPDTAAATGCCGTAGCAPAAGAAADGWLAKDAAEVGVVLVEEGFSGATPPNTEPAGCDAPVPGAVAALRALDAGCGAVADAATSRGAGVRSLRTLGALVAATTATAAVAIFATSAVEAEDPSVPSTASPPNAEANMAGALTPAAAPEAAAAPAPLAAAVETPPALTLTPPATAPGPDTAIAPVAEAEPTAEAPVNPAVPVPAPATPAVPPPAVAKPAALALP
jgi:hypothetical protein